MPANPIPSKHSHDGTSPPASSPTGHSRATTRPVNPSMPWCTAQSSKMVRDVLPQAAESAPRPLPYGRHRWLIRTTRYIACRKVQVAFATCLQPCSLPSTVWVLTLQKRPLSCKTPSCSLHMPCLKPPVSAFR